MQPDAVIRALERIVVAGGTITTRAFAEVHPELRELSVSQYRVFALVASAPDGLRVTELAGLASARPQAITRLVQRLEAKGFVRAERGTLADRRAVVVRTTEQGARAWSEMSARRRELLAEALESTDLPASMPAALGEIGLAMERACRPTSARTRSRGSPPP